MVYDIINKFNTNYTAISYLLTKIIELRTGDESTKFNEVFNKYFIEKSEKGESEFYKDLLNYLERTGPNLNEKLITSENNKDNNNCCQCLCFPGVDLSHCLGICCFILFY